MGSTSLEATLLDGWQELVDQCPSLQFMGHTISWGPHGDWVPTESHSSKTHLLIHAYWIFSFFLFHTVISSLVFPGFISQLNYLHSSPGLRFSGVEKEEAKTWQFAVFGYTGRPIGPKKYPGPWHWAETSYFLHWKAACALRSSWTSVLGGFRGNPAAHLPNT